MLVCWTVSQKVLDISHTTHSYMLRIKSLTL
jgi:hypothetical protein